MGKLKLDFQFSSMTELKQFEALVSSAIESSGRTSLQISEDFDDFLAFKDNRGPICQDFIEFMNFRGYGFDHAELANAA